MTDFARLLLRWFQRHGRHDLPWQRDPSPYRVWISEIMLQQTQVSTTIPYFERFMKRFPDVAALASAPLDDVLHLWSGLGYYARARNLHRAAEIVVAQYAGELPDRPDALMALPGIGRSTAGAILALGHNRPVPILDGNVKRVLCRYHGIHGWPGKSAVEKRLWLLAETHTPKRRAAAYTQAIMDLGATLCTRARPACSRCPVRSGCVANRDRLQTDLPESKPARKLPVRRTVFALIRDAGGGMLLERRPAAGIWGGLWSLPECPPDRDIGEWVQERFGWPVTAVRARPPMRHTFSHFHLDIRPMHVQVACTGQVAEDGDRVWLKPDGEIAYGVAAPVRRLIKSISSGKD